ncbi:hypothetical protein CkaCkLH20_10808 [Colletotrichum karsti]|uniref:RNase MRP protein 1 RNA binding domain-containing protein n=1 Tax=Colletotrichum karsti TaxID=1095194 RepID=A0A9P6HWX5_9PEZI|nr:uncharacterized protein CkaCkLH20_10808 [Colletotrichum karsti]KAF9871610.1 hypothetical protein CkaCkLH20_10808 [Colletotrichum karsti]
MNGISPSTKAKQGKAKFNSFVRCDMLPAGPEVDPSDGRGPDEQISSALSPLFHILDSFHHRNKNQHRVAHWWSQFGILRRAVTRLHDAFVARLRTTQALSFKKQRQKPSKARQTLDEDIAVRVKTLVDATIPSSFLTFTQLTADNQHAALGLVLLGVLASINSAIAPLVAHQDEPGQTAPSTSVPLAGSANETKRDARPVDLGVAVPRDQLRLAINAGSRPEPQAKDTKKPKKRKVTTLVDDVPTTKDNGKTEKKPKKKSKKGDEFSDLFSSLM